MHGTLGVISTDAPVNRGDWVEVLQHTPDSVDLTRAPLPLVDSHNTGTSPFGVVDQLRVAGGKLRGIVRFGNSQRAKELLADVKAGVLRSLSIGYEILKHRLEGNTVIATRWMPYEASCVACPADPGAGFFRSAESIMETSSERDRCAGIIRASRMFDRDDQTLDAIERGETLSEFRQRAMLSSVTRPAALGMSRTELKRYSLARALLDLAQPPGYREKSFEWEIHDELAKRHVGEHGVALTGQPENRITLLIPPDVAADVLRRDLTVGLASTGGYLADTQNLPSWVELARPRSVALTLGVESLDGLRSSITVARETGGPTVSWTPTEATPASESTPATGQIVLTPKQAAVYTEFSRQLLLQSSPAVDRFLTRSLLAAVGTAIDISVLNGSGASGQPLGLVGTPGIGTVSGTALALAGVHEFQTDIGDNLAATCGYATTRAVAKLLAERERLTGSGVSLWSGSLYEGVLGGFPAMTSGNVPASHLLFGDWPQILLASWGTLAVELNPFANFTAGIYGARVLHALDVGVLRSAAFSVATAVT